MNWNYSKTAVAGIIVDRGIRIDMANLSFQNPPAAITSHPHLHCCCRGIRIDMANLSPQTPPAAIASHPHLHCCGRGIRIDMANLSPQTPPAAIASHPHLHCCGRGIRIDMANLTFTLQRSVLTDSGQSLCFFTNGRESKVGNTF